MDLEFPELVRSLPVYDGPFDAFKLESEQFNVLFASYPAGTAIANHQHGTENLGVVTRGGLYLTTGEQTRYFGPGDWYHLEPQERHAARFEKDTQIIEFWFAGGKAYSGQA